MRVGTGHGWFVAVGVGRVEMKKPPLKPGGGCKTIAMRPIVFERFQNLQSLVQQAILRKHQNPCKQS